MDGIENITARILSDAKADVQAVEAETAEKVQAIREQYARQAEQEAAAILSRGKKAAEERLERLESAAQMERRKLELAAKQQVLEEAFDKALDDLCSLRDEDLIALLAALAARAAVSGKEQLIFSESDRARVGKQVVMAANELLVKGAVPALPDMGEGKVGAFLDKMIQTTASKLTGTGMLTLSEQTRPIRRGFVLSDGEVEVNCAFETMVRVRREQLEKEVADILFA